MRVIKVNKRDRPGELRHLIPWIAVADSCPVYGRAIYAQYEYPVSDSVEWFLLQSPAGYVLDSHGGLLKFIEDSGYLGGGKLRRFRDAGKPPVMSGGEVISSAGRFYSNPNVIEMFQYCCLLRISNRVFSDGGEGLGSIVDMLNLPLGERLLEAERIGYSLVLRQVLSLLEGFFCGSGSMTSWKFRSFRDLAVRLNKLGFRRSFNLTGDDSYDAQKLLTLF